MIDFFKDNNITEYRELENGSYDILQDVYIKTKISKFPIKFNSICGNFNAYDIELETLENGPIYVSGNFKVYGNKLKSLEHSPTYVGGDFCCTYNKITSLEGMPNSCKTLTAGFNYLKDLKGIANTIDGDLNISNNLIEDVSNNIYYIKGSLYCQSNKIKNGFELPIYKRVLFIDSSVYEGYNITKKDFEIIIKSKDDYPIFSNNKINFKMLNMIKENYNS